MRVGIATDHGGFGLKEELVAHLREAGHEVVDFGAHDLNPDDDYPDFVVPLARAVAAGTVERGVAVCGSGVGASICATKVRGARASLVEDHFSARQGVEDDTASNRLDRRIAAEHITVLRRRNRGLFQVQLRKDFLTWLYFVAVE